MAAWIDVTSKYYINPWAPAVTSMTKALLACLLLCAGSAHASYQCGVFPAGRYNAFYWRDRAATPDGKAYLSTATPVKGARSQVEAELERTNAKIPKAENVFLVLGPVPGLTNVEDRISYCTDPTNLLPNGQVLDTNCGGLSDVRYHERLDAWASLGWADLERPGLGRVAEFSIAPLMGLYQMHAWMEIQPMGPKVASWVFKEASSFFGACAVRPTLVGYFNGVWNTEPEAQYSLGRIRREYGTSRGGIPLEYHLFYNQTGCHTNGNKTIGCLMDLAETFAQRQQEFEQELQHRWEYFWDMAAHRDDADTSWLGQLRQQLAKTAAPLFAKYRSLADAMRSRAQALSAHLVEVPPTTSDAAAHLAALKETASRDMHALLISHSQGNLFANTAYDAFYQLHLRGLFSPPELKMVHIAPASATVRGDYVLGDTDLVIGALRAIGVQALAPNVVAKPSMDDPSGHQFGATYFGGITGPAQIVKPLIAKALDAI